MKNVKFAQHYLHELNRNLPGKQNKFCLRHFSSLTKGSGIWEQHSSSNRIIMIRKEQNMSLFPNTGKKLKNENSKIIFC